MTNRLRGYQGLLGIGKGAYVLVVRNDGTIARIPREEYSGHA